MAFWTLLLTVVTGNLAGPVAQTHGNLFVAWDADAICIGRVTSVESGISVPLVPRGSATPLETIRCAILHVNVEGSLIGDLPQEVTVLASERVLRRWGLTSEPVSTPSGSEPLVVPNNLVGRASIGARIEPLKDIVGFHGLIQLEKAGPDGAFYRDSRDFLRERHHAIDPKQPAVGVARCAGATYALHSFDDEGGTWALYPTEATRYDPSLPPGLRLLDFIATDTLSGEPFQTASLQELRRWNPLDSVPERPWLTDLKTSAIEVWFRARFADGNLTTTQQMDQDILGLRVDWGDQTAYPRFKAVTMRLGKPAKWTWLPRQSDPDLLLFLVARTRSGEKMRSLFMLLSQHPEAKAKILAASARMLGKNRVADQGILECLYKLTGNPALSPSNEKGMKNDLSACLKAAQRELQKCKASN